MKVYVIEKGYYSDRHIIGIVETKKEADEICKVLYDTNSYDKDSIGYSEYDTKQFQTNRLRFHVSCLYDEWEAEYDDYDIYENYKENTETYEDSYIIYANSPDQAIKIAQDMRAEKLTKDKGLI